MKYASLLLFLVFSFSASVKATTVEEYFTILSKTKADYDPTGAVCEKVAMIEIEPNYPKSQFEIINSLEYGDNKKTIGELDLVVISKDTGMVEAVAEVKCWKSFSGALKKAKDQRNRFLSNLNKKITITDKDQKEYSQNIFKHITKYFTISQDGGASQGFDFELSLDLKELMKLRGLLLDCYAQGKCPAK